MTSTPSANSAVRSADRDGAANCVVCVTLHPAIDQTVFVDRFRPGSVNLARRVLRHAAGKGVNVATALAGYGCAVEVTGFLGRDNAELFAEHFARKGIADRFLCVSGRTRAGIKIVDETVPETTDVNLPGPPVGGDMLDRLAALLEELAVEGRWFVLSGSLPPGLSEDSYALLTRRIHDAGGRVALDTSGEALQRGVAARPDLIKPNVRELGMLHASDLSAMDEIVNAARGLLDRGVATVVVSMGEEGAVFLEGDEAIRAVPPAVPVVSTVAAGDAMVAGMVAGDLERRPLVERARLATAFSACAVQQAGAELRPDAVREFEPRVEVAPVG